MRNSSGPLTLQGFLIYLVRWIADGSVSILNSTTKGVYVERGTPVVQFVYLRIKHAAHF